jgi:transposase-like protein
MMMIGEMSVDLAFGMTVSAKCWTLNRDERRMRRRRRVLALHGWLDSASTFNMIVPEIMELWKETDQPFGIEIIAPDFLV